MSDDVKVQGEMERRIIIPTSMQDLLATAEYGLKEVKRGDVLAGTILDISEAGILVSVDGIKSEGIISGEELSKIPRDVLDDLKVGDTVQTYVVAPVRSQRQCGAGLDPHAELARLGRSRRPEFHAGSV